MQRNKRTTDLWWVLSTTAMRTQAHSMRTLASPPELFFGLRGRFSNLEIEQEDIFWRLPDADNSVVARSAAGQNADLFGASPTHRVQRCSGRAGVRFQIGQCE